MEPAQGLDPDTLLAHREFVRAVVRRLLRDDDETEDAVQETLFRALRSPPRDGGALRAWLARVGRNVALSIRRGDRRRARRERAAAQAEAVPSPIDAASRLDQLRLVVEAVRALDEPFRSAVLLRYYDDLPPSEIARRLGVPVDTVHSRLRRAVERMRGWFDARHGGSREAWGLALLPLLHVPANSVGSAAVLHLGGGLMKAKLVAVALVLSAVAVGVVAWRNPGKQEQARARTDAYDAVAPSVQEAEADVRGQEDARRAGPLARDLSPNSHDDIASTSTPGGGGRDSRVVVGRPHVRRPFRFAESSADPAAGALRVMVMDDSGSPLGGARVIVSVWTGSSYERRHDVATGADGRVEIASLAPGRALVLVALPPRYRSAQIEVEAGRVTEIEVPFASGARVEGMVRHMEKGPLSNAQMRLERRDGGLSETLWATTDGGGRYRFDAVPEGTYDARFPGDASKRLVVAGRGTLSHDFVLGEVSIEGVVRDTASGQPLPDSKVYLQPWQPNTVTDASGTYRFVDLPPGEYTVTVHREGYGSGMETSVPVVAETPRRVDFALERAALLIVEVHDREGRPVPGRHALSFVRVGREVGSGERLDVDGTGCGRCTRLPPGTYDLELQVEGFLPQGKRLEIVQGENRWAVTIDRAEPQSKTSIEGTLRDKATGRPIAGVRVTALPQKGVSLPFEGFTDDEGAYRLHDMPDNTYVLQFSRDGYGFESLRDIEVGSGTRTIDARLVPAARLRLFATDRNGKPVAGGLFLGITSTDGSGTQVGIGVDADSQGMAVYHQIVPGSYRLRVKHGLAEAEVEAEIVPGNNDVRVRLE